MKTNFLILEAKKWYFQRNASFIVICLLSFVLLFESLTLVLHRDRIVMVPMGSQKGEIWVDRFSASSDYLERLAVFFVERLMNTNPENRVWNRDSLLNFVSAKYYGDFKQYLLEEEKRLNDDSISTTFDLQEAEVVSLAFNTVRVKGTLFSYVRGREVSREKMSFVVKFAKVGHSLLVESFKLEDSK